VAALNQAEEEDRTHTITRHQKNIQTQVRHIWDLDYQTSMRNLREVLSADDNNTLPATTAARLSIVHPECATADYGDTGNQDDVLKASEFMRTIGNSAFNKSISARNGPMSSDSDDDSDDSDSHPTSPELREKFREMISRNRNWKSPRISAMLETADRHIRTGGGKILIFSEFLCVLDVAEAALSSKNYQCLRLDEQISDTETDNAIDWFTKDPDYKILLITNKSGEYGLNLTVANLVMHLTPSLDSLTTRQCTRRAARPGQTKDVAVIHFYCHESIERHVRRVSATRDKKSCTIWDPSAEELEAIAAAGTWDRSQFIDIVSIDWVRVIA
jgi:SNF2 family DNA or RNA helicase